MVGELLVALGAGGAAIVAVFKLAETWQAYQERKALLDRLQQITARPVSSSEVSEVLFRQNSQQLGAWWKLLQHAPLLQGSTRLLEQAGLDWKPMRLVELSLGGLLIGVVAGYAVSGRASVALAGLALGVSIPFLYVRRARSRRCAKLEEQLPEAIDLLGRSIRAGHAIGTGFRLVSEESPEPIAAEFRRTFEEQKYGMPFEESLHSMARRVPLVDVRVMVVAILIQREVGGNLAEILDKLAHLVRARFGLRRQMLVYTAQGRLSGYVLGFLPLALGGVISMINPEYIQVLFHDPLGKLMLGVAGGLQLAGYVWIWRILKLDL